MTVNFNTRSVGELRTALVVLRRLVDGKTFGECPEHFKDIEGCKTRIAWLTR